MLRQDGFVYLDGNRLRFKCAPLPPAALLYIRTRIFSWRHCACLVRSGRRTTRPTFPQQHRRDYAHRRLVVIRARNDLAEIRLN
jgi:hypothetical protein